MIRQRNAELEHRNPVQYKGANAGDYSADYLVGGRVIVELKAAPECQTAGAAKLLINGKPPALEQGCLSTRSRQSRIQARKEHERNDDPAGAKQAVKHYRKSSDNLPPQRKLPRAPAHYRDQRRK